MLNKLGAFIREQEMILPGDRIVCALSGGADSVALLFGLYLLRDVCDFELSAAHFNHHLRGAESDRDEAFARDFCGRYEIPITVGGGRIVPGEKGMEAAARDARYAFLNSLPGKIATAHTADDNAETILMHLVRGTGLKGLGGIAPKNGKLIRPMLTITRNDVEAFLEEYSLPHVEDSSNAGDAFLRNRIRHGVMPLLKAENPRLSENLSAMAMGLRQEEHYLQSRTEGDLPTVTELRSMHPAIRRRWLEKALKCWGVREPEQIHLEQAERLVFSPKPSAQADFPGGIVICRSYDRLERQRELPQIPEQILTVPCTVEMLRWGLRLICTTETEPCNTPDCFTASVQGPIVLRSRAAGDSIRLSGGSKPLKKWMIDQKIPAWRRCGIPVIADSLGIVGVMGIGRNLNRSVEPDHAVTFRFERLPEQP